MRHTSGSALWEERYNNSCAVIAPVVSIWCFHGVRGSPSGPQDFKWDELAKAAGIGRVGNPGQEGSQFPIAKRQNE